MLQSDTAREGLGTELTALSFGILQQSGCIYPVVTVVYFMNI